jgi:hypothetical protein
MAAQWLLLPVRWWSNGPSSWCLAAASALLASAGVTDVAVRFESAVTNERKNPAHAGFFFGLRQRGREIPALSRKFYQFLKQRRPNGPECQPGGQLNIGRHPP